ncbi:uncharacterized protein LOC135929927 isoform X2 [Gordionus sp. m RMFG-2023]|uniref:uncharacterized protein LOC135929927 isoform X2 n=1 Tax=Gordionus sp. m RMFG-2023 TaxID=3053472 RepID=UPI0031FD8958
MYGYAKHVNNGNFPKIKSREVACDYRVSTNGYPMYKNNTLNPKLHNKQQERNLKVEYYEREDDDSDQDYYYDQGNKCMEEIEMKGGVHRRYVPNPLMGRPKAAKLPDKYKCPYCNLNIKRGKLEIHIEVCSEKSRLEKYGHYQHQNDNKDHNLARKMEKLKLSKENGPKKVIRLPPIKNESSPSNGSETSDEEAEDSRINEYQLEVEDGIMKFPENYKAKNIEIKTRYYDPCTNRNNHLMHIQQNTIWLKNVRDTLATAGYVGMHKAKNAPVIKKKFYISSTDSDRENEMDMDLYSIPRMNNQSYDRKSSKIYKNTIKIPRSRMLRNIPPLEGQKLMIKPANAIYESVGKRVERGDPPPPLRPKNQHNKMNELEKVCNKMQAKKCRYCNNFYPSPTVKFCAECGTKKD